MRVVVFCHSLVSDWNHGNAHFLRGVVAELQARGHEVRVFEPANGWSRQQLLARKGPAAVDAFHRAFPALSSSIVDVHRLDLDEALDGAAVVLVHEWSSHALVERIGRHKASGGRYVLLFHDTHHRSATDAAAMRGYDLQHYDGVLAFGEAIRARYLACGWASRAWTWHEAADVRVFTPRPPAPRRADLVWIGNWGDEERSAEIRAFLVEPVRALGLRARVHGVRYPASARRVLAGARIHYGGWLPNHEAPCVFARHRMTVHIPRRPYADVLPGIPTIRVFEALACGIPLVSAWWDDCEGLFTPGADYLLARTPEEMEAQLRAVTHDDALAASLAGHGLATVRARHTCAHRVDELLAVVRDVHGTANDEVLTA
jgi:spore maturation protein CgeB